MSETLSREKRTFFDRSPVGRKKKPHVSIEISTIETGGAFSRDCPTSGGNKKHASKLRNPFAGISNPSSRYYVTPVGSTRALERFDMLLGRVRHLGGGARARGATAAGRVTHLQNTEPGMPAFQRLMSVYSAEAMVASGVFPGSDPMNPMRTAVLFAVSETGVSDTKGNELSDGARGETRVNPAATPPRRPRIARGLPETSRGSAGARRDRRARRARSPAARRVADTCVTSEGTDLTRVRQKARGGDARGRLARARARRGAGSGAWRGRATSHRGCRGERIGLRSRTYLVTSPVLMSRRSCLSTRTAAFLNTPPVAAVREERGIKGERERSENARDVRDVASTFDRARRGIVPRLAPERVAPSPTGHAMPRAA